ncbi:hypothetical protein K1719_039360 [Acacia pycnantha]|nr:hypothetical protein K1719_039360 [Acacia pycnantha]
MVYHDINLRVPPSYHGIMGKQLGCSRKQEFHPGSVHFNLPSQILCRVINIQLLVEPSSNEIYFRITLLPDIDTDPTVPDPAAPEIQKHEMYSFWKILTASITSTHGVSDGQQSPIPSSVIPSKSTHIGVLATASHAVMSGTMFVVYYRQRASQFVIRLNKYLEAMDNDIHVGMRFKMGFQREDSLDEISCFGTFVDIGDFSPEWPGSKWRSLQVQWDEPATIPRPEKVSPWEIEPITMFNSKSFKLNHNLSSGSTSNLPTSLLRKSNNNSRMRVDGMQLASPLWNESLIFLSDLGKDKAGLNDYSSFLSGPEKDKDSNTSALGWKTYFLRMNEKEANDGRVEPDEDDTLLTRRLEGRSRVLNFTAEEYSTWCLPRMNSLILKVLGASFPTYVIRDCINRMWCSKYPLKLIPLSNGYYIVSFSNKEDKDYAFQQGPWMIEDHYLIVQRWRPNFNPWKDDLQRCIVAWIQLPNVPFEFYNIESLCRIGNMDEAQRIVETEVGRDGDSQMMKKGESRGGSTIVIGDESSGIGLFRKLKVLRQDFRGAPSKAGTREGVIVNSNLTVDQRQSEESNGSR